MHRQDGRQEIDRRALLAKGAAFCGASRRAPHMEMLTLSETEANTLLTRTR
ncbi:MAG: hypothetical protein ACREV8_16400 [Gammaproteobacteria bacterium]